MKKPNPPTETFGSLIRQARTSRGLTQLQLAQAARYRQSEISQWESGRVVPETNTLQRLAEALSISLIELIPEAD